MDNKLSDMQIAIRITFLLISILLITLVDKVFSQTPQTYLQKINQARIVSGQHLIDYADNRQEEAGWLLDKYINEGFIDNNAGAYVEYYEFNGSRVNIEAIIDVAQVGENSWFYDDIDYAVFSFRHMPGLSMTFGMGIFYKKGPGEARARTIRSNP